MNIKIIALCFLSMQYLSSCQKTNQVSDQSLKITPEQKEVMTEAKTNLKALLPTQVFNSLDWNHAIFNKVGNECTITIALVNHNGDKVLYYTNGNDQMYEYKNDVHFINNNHF